MANGNLEQSVRAMRADLLQCVNNMVFKLAKTSPMSQTDKMYVLRFFERVTMKHFRFSIILP